MRALALAVALLLAEWAPVLFGLLLLALFAWLLPWWSWLVFLAAGVVVCFLGYRRGGDVSD